MLLYLEDRPAHRVSSHVDETGSFSRAVQKLSRIVALSLNGGNLTVHVFGVLANIEWVSIKLMLELAPLCSEAERLAQS